MTSGDYDNTISKKWRIKKYYDDGVEFQPQVKITIFGIPLWLDANCFAKSTQAEAIEWIKFNIKPKIISDKTTTYIEVTNDDLK